MAETKTTGARRGEATREAIEAAAVDLFAERGYHATSMREIASAAKVQPAAIYHWFDSKEKILTRLQDDFMDRLEAAVEEAVAAEATPPGQLAAAVREHVVFHGLHAREAFVTDSEIRALSTRPRNRLIARRDAYQTMFRQMIEAGVKSGDFTISNPAVASYAILLECTGVALWYDPKGALALDEIAAIHVELVLGSLGAAPKVAGRTGARKERR
ncbi:MAG: TetR family transcriptional regulator [Solirubrobacterales bacterium]|nr:TetR family transcriptional regulator [Solirubrobacterales bacterium]MCB0859641.1 TetR family transcriptional regulator [Solirubrobacterales bacterium]HRV59006.1 TetR/AcrR family transcriptional regulator [Solirubrobacterales bacterium]